MPEYRTLTTLLPRIATATLLVLLAGTFIGNNEASGTLNKPMYLAILALGFAITALFLRSRQSTRLDTALAVASSAGLLWGIWSYERPELLASFWEGFGSRVTLAVVVLLLLGIVFHPQTLSRWIRLGLGLIVAICCVCDLLSLIRTFDFMPIVSNNVNEINDVLAPAAGNIPDSTFIPQYTALYGWPFAPLGHVLSPNALVGAVAIFFTLLAIACVLLAVWVTRRALGTRGFILAAAFVVPIACVTTHAGATSSIASLFQELPIRLLSGFVVAALGLNDLVLLYRGTLRIRFVLLVGVVCGVVGWNSQDFGGAAAGVYGLMIILCATRAVRRRAFAVWCAGLVIGVASYPLFLFVIGSPLDLGFVAAFIKIFTAGFGLVPIQVPGPVLVVMPIVVCSAAAGWALVRNRHREGVRTDPLLDRATITLTFVGTWSAVCMVYYVNRAFAAGQLQTMLLPSGVCIGTMYSILIHTDEYRALTVPGSLHALWTGLSVRVAMVPLGMFVCLCFASTILTPNPVSTLTDVVKPPPMSGYSGDYPDYGTPQLVAAVRLAQRYTSGKPGELTYLGDSFNYVSLVTHVRSISLFFPEVSPSFTEIQCQYLRTHHSEWMVLSPFGVNAYGADACGMYRPVAVRGLILGQLQQLK